MRAQAPPAADTAQLLTALRAITGGDALVTSIEQRTFYSTDIAGGVETAEVVVRVSDRDALAQVVRACTERGFSVIARGGGFSYTGGYTPTQPRSVLLDMRPMCAIQEINDEDMYVVVESGCTWERLYEALKARGLRTPYFGPMSGYHATIGGATSQGSFFLGSTQYGTVAESVLGLEVVLADGAILRTGSWGSREGTPPFMRQYGPDLTGLFLSDNGSLGIKTRMAMRLIPFPPRHAFGSFAFSTHGEALKALSSIGRTGLAAECYCWDPFFVRLMAASTDWKQGLQLLLKVMKSGSGWLHGLMGAARMAIAGRRPFQGNTWLLHVAIDDASAAGAAARLRQLRALALEIGGREISPSAPLALRARPFMQFNVPERRSERRNLPVHGIAPHSRAAAVCDEVYDYLAQQSDAMSRGEVACGVIMFAVGVQAVAIEPLIYWNDPMHYLHDRVRERSDTAALAAYGEPPPARRQAMLMKDAFKSLFRRHGCTHVQIARSYPWAETREPTSLRLLQSFKNAVDPRGLINTGALGFTDAPEND